MLFRNLCNPTCHNLQEAAQAVISSHIYLETSMSFFVGCGLFFSRDLNILSEQELHRNLQVKS